MCETLSLDENKALFMYNDHNSAETCLFIWSYTLNHEVFGMFIGIIAVKIKTTKITWWKRFTSQWDLPG